MTAEESGAMRWEALHAEVCGDCDDTVIHECPSKLWQAVEQELLLIAALEAERDALRKMEGIREVLSCEKCRKKEDWTEAAYIVHCLHCYKELTLDPLTKLEERLEKAEARVKELEAHECEHEHCGDAGCEPDREEC